MKSTTAAPFWKHFAQLPLEVQRQAYKAYELFSVNAAHPSLKFEEIDPTGRLWSARVSETYRVVGKRTGDEIRWFWIGMHNDCERFTGKH
ncbi:MAG TPA: hypothetical protein VIC85_02310 [Ktedonobacterales bacterium]